MAEAGSRTWRRLVDLQVLVYYDGPQLILARDEGGGEALAVLAEVDSWRDVFACVRCAPELMASLRAGAIDLRTAFVSAAPGDVARGVFSADQGAIDVTPLPSLPEAWLPAAGVRWADLGLAEAEGAADDDTRRSGRRPRTHGST